MIIWIIFIAEFVTAILILIFENYFRYLVSLVSPRVSDIPKDISTALFVAAFLTLTFEPLVKRYIRKDIKQHLDKVLQSIKAATFSTLLSGILSEAIFKQVNDFLIKRPYLLKNIETILQFEKSNDDNFLILTDTTSFQVYNLANFSVDYPFRANEVTEVKSKFPNYPSIKSLSVDGKEYNIQELKERGIIKDEGNRLRISLPIPVQPQKNVRVIFTVEKVVRNEDHDSWDVTDKTENMCILCSRLDGMKVEAYPIHPEIEEPLKPVLDQGKNIKWELNTGILPNQGIELSWSFKGDESQSDS